MNKERTPTETIKEEIKEHIITRLLKEPAMSSDAVKGAATAAVNAMSRVLGDYGQYKIKTKLTKRAT